MTDEEAKTFWATKSPSDVATLLRAAPFVAEPWVKYGDGWHRDTLRCGDGLPIVEAHDNGWWQVYGDDHASGNVKGAEAAKAAADAHLTRLGWVLL